MQRPMIFKVMSTLLVSISTELRVSLTSLRMDLKGKLISTQDKYLPNNSNKINKTNPQ